MVTVTKITAGFVPIRFRALRASVENNLSQETIRSIELDHIGRMSKRRKSILFFKLEKEMKYAVG